MTCPTSEATAPRTPRGRRIARWATLGLMTAALLTPASAVAYNEPGGFITSGNAEPAATASAPSSDDGGNTLPIVLSGSAMLIAVGSAGFAASTRERARRSPQPGV